MTQQELDLLYSGGIDAQTALKLLMGKETIYRKYLLRFPQDENYDHLLDAVKNQDAEGAFRAVHTLKGSAGNIGAFRISETADALTEWLRPLRADHPDLSEIQPEIRALGDRIAKAFRVIEEFRKLTEIQENN